MISESHTFGNGNQIQVPAGQFYTDGALLGDMRTDTATYDALSGRALNVQVLPDMSSCSPDVVKARHGHLADLAIRSQPDVESVGLRSVLNIYHHRM
jgi:hypothetical protein